MAGRMWAAVGAAIVLHAATGGAKTLPVRGIVYDTARVVESVRWHVDGRAAVGHVPSARNLLGLERPHRFGLPTAASAARLKTVRVAVLRVQFPLEVPDDPRTTGNGNIDLRDSLTFFIEEGHAFETAPHNSEFFATIMRAMAQYYDVVSNALLTVDYDIFPTDRDSSYTLDSSMCYYGLLPPNEGLAYLLIDGVLKADSDPDFLFGDYDAVMIFHAGSDAQHDFSPITPTPCDLYTGFVRLLDPALFVPVDGATHFIQEAVILPETATQDNRGTGLNGVTAHEFGHQLGLVDIYNTRTFFTQVGDFSLMDNDAQQVGIEFGVPWTPNTFFDLLPVYPDAWSRAYLGFVIPMVVPFDSIGTYMLSVAEGTSRFDQLIKIPITAKEYYLAEFRSPDEDLNTDPARPGDQGVGIRFDSSFNAVLGPSRCNPATEAEADSCRVLGRDYDFQFFQPGDSGGLLIWHIDEEVAYQSVPQIEGDPYLENNFDANTLQWNRFRRFMEIEEADGLVDFGGNYFTYFGGQRELFGGGGNNEFGPATNPSTRSHTGAPSHIRVFDISPVLPPDAIPLHRMTLKVGKEHTAANWPNAAGHSDASELAVVTGTGSDTVLASSGRYVLGWDAGGNRLLTQLPGDSAYAIMRSFDGTADTVTLNGFARADTTLATAPSVGSDTSTGTRWVAAVDVAGTLYIWEFVDANTDGWADEVYRVALAAPAPQPPLWFDFDADGDEELWIAASSGRAYVWDQGTTSNYALQSSVIRDWSLTWRDSAWAVYAVGDTRLEQAYPFDAGAAQELGRAYESIVAMDDDRDGHDAIFARAGSILSKIAIGTQAAFQAAAERDMMLPVHGPLTSGDHDGNGVPSIFVGAGEWMAGYQPNLSPESNFPLRGNDLYDADPLCAAITSQSLVFFGGADGEVQGYKPDRTFAPGWPFFAGDTVTSTAAVAYGTDSMIVLARSTGGYIRGTTQEGTVRPPGSWTQFRASAARINRWDPTGVGAPAPSPASQASETVYAYPNPASRGPVTIRYYLEESSSVDVRIYDLAGNEVTRATTSGIGGMDNEWIWNASGVAPGIYYCRVQATRGGRDVAEFCKVAITP